MAAYHEGELAVQRQAGVLVNAARIGRAIHETIPPIAQEFAAAREFAILGAADAAGRVWAGVVRGNPGFLAAAAASLRVDALPRTGDPLAKVLAREADIGMLLLDPLTRRRFRVNGRSRPDRGGFSVAPREVYANCPKYITPRAPFTAPATAAGALAVAERGTRLTDAQRDRLRSADTLFLASRHPEAGADVSHRGGAPGFVHVPAADRIVLPDYAGNMMFNTLGNIAASPAVGLLLVDFTDGATLQVSGRARIDWDPARVAAHPGAQRLLEIVVDEVVELGGG